MDPLLIDECLSPGLAAAEMARVLTAMHVTWLNREGSEVHEAAVLAAGRDYIIVTNNRRGFLRLYQQLAVHNGLIIVVPSVDAPAREALFERAFGTAEMEDSLINLLIEVRADGTVDVRNWSKDAL
jgi:hypothetical protein